MDINDVDDEGDFVPKQVALDYAKSIKAHFFLTSAKENMGISKMFQQAAEMCAKT